MFSRITLSDVIYILILVFIIVFFNPSNAQTNNLSHKKDIVPIVQKRCAMCHSTMLNSNWLSYKDAFNKRKLIKLRLENRTMPIGVTMPDNERAIMIEWVNQGAKP